MLNVIRILLASTLAASVIGCMAEPTAYQRKARPGASEADETDDTEDEEGEPSQGGAKSKTKAPGGTEDPEDETKTPTDPAKPEVTDATNGTGGPTGLSELKSAGGLSYMINAPTPGTKARGVLVMLHGSNASNYRNFVGMMATVATANDLIRVSVLAPNGKGWNEGDQVAGATLLNRFIQEDLFPKYNIDKSKVLFSGQSSGGGFLSTHFIPAHGKNYRGGAFLQCGAAPPRVTFAPDAAMKAGFRMHFEITTGDTIWPTSYASAVDVYTKAGMSLTKDNTKTGGHCAFDQQKVIQDHIAFVLAPR